MSGQKTLSAEAVLRPDTGQSLSAARITAQTLESYKADPEAAARARKFFLEAGFEVSESSGLSFSISGPQSLFEKVFHSKIDDPPKDDSLPLGALPSEIAKDLEGVGFSTIDFGPVSY